MIRHIVTITLREDASIEDLETFFERLVPISEHPKAIDYYCGWNFQDLGDPCDIGISCSFANHADFEEYMASPDHGPPGEILRIISDHWSVIDYVEGSPRDAKAATRSERGSA